MKTCLTILIVLLILSVAHAELFKWKDAEGNLIYSDQPPPNDQKEGTKVDKEQLPKIISVPAPEISGSAANNNSASNSKESEERYQKLSIVEPPHDTAIRENSGKVKISVDVEPRIFVERGDILIIYMDGQEVSRGDNTFVRLDNVDRGTHEIKATIVNDKGQVIKETATISFTLQRFHI